MKLIRVLLPLLILGLMWGCKQSDQNFKSQLQKALKDDPTIITTYIKEHPQDVIESLQSAARDAQMAMMQKQQDDQKKELEGAYTNPLKPAIRPDESIRGKADAPITLIEYSDFQCPYCSKGTETVHALMAKYGDKIRVIFKHMPLNFHDQAMLAASYFEAIRLQAPDKAFKFHDKVFAGQKEISKGKTFFDSIAKSVGADMKKLEIDIKSDKVKARIEEDQKEAQSFGIQGTPGFVINGIPVKGAYPVEHFDGIIKELEKRGTLKL